MAIKVNMSISPPIMANVTMSSSSEMKAGFGAVTEVVTSDYEKLNNLPTLNGDKIIGDVNEIDPTVPPWAKEKNKPTYSASEVGAVGEDSEMSLADIKAIWDSIINL